MSERSAIALTPGEARYETNEEQFKFFSIDLEE